MIVNQQLGRAGMHGPRFNARIWMDFESISPDGTTFRDRGTGRSVWARLGTDVEINNDVSPPSGKSWLKLYNTGHALQTDAVAGNMLPATADWDLSFYVRCNDWSPSGVGRYIMSVQDTSATAAGTQFALATNASDLLVFILSDGTTRSTIVTSPTTMAVNTTYRIVTSRRGSTVSITRDGAAYGSGTFAGSINQPAGRKWRISRPELNGNGMGIGYVDSLRLVVL